MYLFKDTCTWFCITVLHALWFACKMMLCTKYNQTFFFFFLAYCSIYFSLYKQAPRRLNSRAVLCQNTQTITMITQIDHPPWRQVQRSPRCWGNYGKCFTSVMMTLMMMTLMMMMMMEVVTTEIIHEYCLTRQWDCITVKHVRPNWCQWMAACHAAIQVIKVYTTSGSIFDNIHVVCKFAHMEMYIRFWNSRLGAACVCKPFPEVEMMCNFDYLFLNLYTYS